MGWAARGVCFPFCLLFDLDGPGIVSRRSVCAGAISPSRHRRALLAAVARIAVDEHCYGIHWEVLGWNEKAIAPYQELGSTFRDQRRAVLLTDEALRRLAEKAR